MEVARVPTRRIISLCRQVGIFALLLHLLLPAIARAEKVDQLKPQGYVNDFAGVLDAQTKEQISALCAEVDQKAHAQVAVVTIHSLEGAPLEDFSVSLAQKWGVGYKGNDRGVLILLAVQDHKYRVEVGYGLEPILPDGKVGGFGREMVPKLRASDYGGALLHLTSQIAGVIAADRGVSLDRLVPEPSPAQPTAPRQWDVWNLVGAALMLVLVAILISFMGFGGFFWFFISLFLGGHSGGRGSSSWGGGFGAGGGGGFRGFGGGSFGGGGASGSW